MLWLLEKTWLRPTSAEASDSPANVCDRLGGFGLVSTTLNTPGCLIPPIYQPSYTPPKNPSPPPDTQSAYTYIRTGDEGLLEAVEVEGLGGLRAGKERARAPA